MAVGICASDTRAAHGRHPFIPMPYHPGHEVVGVVTALGCGVSVAVAVGERVTVEPDLPCLTCKMCTSGRENLCEAGASDAGPGTALQWGHWSLGDSGPTMAWSLSREEPTRREAR